MMRNYNYIPLPELRHRYQRRNRIKRILAETVIEVVFMAVYGIVMGLMLTGLWIVI